MWIVQVLAGGPVKSTPSGKNPTSTIAKPLVGVQISRQQEGEEPFFDLVIA